MQLSTRHERLAHNLESPHVEKFMSTENMSYIHTAIINSVYKATNGKVKIDKQSDQDLRIIMIRIIDSRMTLEELNNAVIQKSTSIILNNISSYLSYMKGIDSSGQHITDAPQSTRSFSQAPERAVF